MKYFKFNAYDLAAACVMIIAVCVRLFLLGQHWPWTDSDEGVFGIMALHIAYQGDHPSFMYGSYYMGPLQAYLGAALFHLFGSSLLTLRLGLVLLFALFLLCLYLLARTLYTRGLALFTLALLSAGSAYLLTYELRSYGGYLETLFFGALQFLIAAKLALTSRREVRWRWLGWRCVGYAAWGLVVGLALWSDALILPLVATSGLLLLLFCWRDWLRGLPLLCLLLGLAIGAFPLIYYNLHAAPGLDTLSVLYWQQHGRNPLPFSWQLLGRQLWSTFQVSIPTITGNPFCPVNEVPVLRDPTSPPSLQCTVVRSAWGAGYLALFFGALTVAAWAAWRAWQRQHVARKAGSDEEERRELVRRVARLLLLVSALLSLCLYVPSIAPVDWPGVHARYLILLLLALPATLWPLWRSARPLMQSTGRIAHIRRDLARLALACMLLLSIAGTGIVFSEIPTAQTYYQQDQALANQLERLGIRHAYADYWTCYKLSFLSNEKIICANVDVHLQPRYNRYQPYYDIVHADPHAAYILAPSAYALALEAQVEQNPGRYRLTFFEGYYIVQPI